MVIRKSEGGYKRTAYIAALAGLAILVAATLSINYAGGLLTNVTSPAGPLEQITIATNTSYAGTCPIIVAQEKGYFVKEGINAVVQAHFSGKASMEAVFQGQANLGTVADIPIMFAGMNSRPVAVIATIFKTEKDHGIVGRRDRGVSTPASLKGKRIGVALSTSAHFTLEAFLNRQKLAANEVTMQNYKPEELTKALEQGEVDAVATWEPFMDTLMTRLGSNGVVFYGEDVYESLYNVVGMRDFIANRPETIKKVLRALAQGVRFCRDSPDAARELVSGIVKSDTRYMKAAWPSYRFAVALDQGLILALEDEARWAIKNKLTSNTDVPNYLNYIYLDGLEAVNPSAVTITH